nr:AAA family ATPase [uncultured Butyrivibrio sp.]
MKFTKLVINNFMRFKGENTIEFSCDDDKNVTVVLGDNTVGKTTLAQAIRWVLYGEIISTQYEGNKDVTILNNDVLGNMTANDYAEVKVELDFEQEKNNSVNAYRIVRLATYARKFPQMTTRQISEKLKMYIKDGETGSEIPYDNTGKDEGKVDELISEFLPKQLSSYFLFDGERWNDAKTTKADIRDSIYNLVGISPIRQMKYHLGEHGTRGSLSVIKRLEGKKSGVSEEYGRIEKEIEALYKKIEQNNKEIEDNQENAKHFWEKADEKQALLDSNPNVEQDQKEYKRLEGEISACTKRMESFYADIVDKFSGSYTYFAAPLMQEIVDMLDGVDLKGVDLPGVTNKTIETILSNHKCLCGHDIADGSPEEEALLKLKKLVPPAVIGTIVGNFKGKLAKWSADSADMYETIKNKADSFQSESDDKYDNEEQLAIKERKIDRKINFEAERRKLNEYKSKAREYDQAATHAEGLNQSHEIRIKTLEEQKSSLEDKSEQNARLDVYIEYAKQLYAKACDIYGKKEGTLLSDLNAIIEKNFKEMFKEQEKYAKLDEDYVLRLYYKKISNSGDLSTTEATVLSEGEKIARNFAFIVSILELANNMKADNEDAEVLPLVLDGPFSKLSDVNTAKVASVMPKVAEQVIVFMLDKDWEPSGLADYTDKKYMYRVSKNIDENSSSITRNTEA